jgi:hypothetical protein
MKTPVQVVYANEDIFQKMLTKLIQVEEKLYQVETQIYLNE